MKTTPWKDHFTNFKDSPKGLIELLTTEELPVADYIQWASHHYQLPFLSDAFFQKANQFELLVQNPNTQWNEFFFPISEWQNTLYIGCVEPKSVTCNKKINLVICSPQHLSQLWKKMHPPHHDNLESKLQLEETKSEIRITENTQTAVRIREDIVPKAKAQMNMNPNASTNSSDIPEITNVIRVSKSAQDKGSFTNTKTIMPFPERTTQFTFVRTVYSQQVILEGKAKIQDNTNPQDALISAFRILKDYYKKLMWIVRDQKGSAFPIACNSDWEFTDVAWETPLDFKTPNPFRIAKLTQKPFHGPVSKNPASDLFFKSWGYAKYPDVLSIVPLQLDGKVFGYLMACEKGPHYKEDTSIQLMESISIELIQSFLRIHKELAKVS